MDENEATRLLAKDGFDKWGRSKKEVSRKQDVFENQVITGGHSGQGRSEKRRTMKVRRRRRKK